MTVKTTPCGEEILQQLYPGASRLPGGRIFRIPDGPKLAHTAAPQHVLTVRNPRPISNGFEAGKHR